VKLGAGPAFHLPDLNGVVDGVTVTPPEVVRLETVYYDTPDLRLARWGVSLRHRAGEGWTLKLSPSPPRGEGSGEGRGQAALLERDEITFQGGTKKPPAAALALVRAYVRTSELAPVARLSTMRRRVRLIGADGSRVAEVVDDEVSVRDGRRVAARFREIEIEVAGADGNEAIVAPFVERLRAAGAGAPDPTPKHIRALGPRAMEPPEVAPLPVTPDSPARDVIRSVLAEAVAAILRNDPLVRDRVERWLQSPGLSGFRVSEVMAFTNNDYVAVQDARGKPAFELLTEPSGWLMEEPPSMMWNTRYGMMGRASRSWTGSGMMGGGMMSGNWTGRYGTGNGWDGGGQGTVTSLAQAVKVADRWLSQARQGERAETDGRAFPGYYTLDTTRSGKTTGMLSVNASTGAVWYHSWHGRFLAERKF